MSLSMDRLLEPLSFAEFYEGYYEKKPLLLKRQSPAYYDDLLTLNDINEHLGSSDLVSGALRLVRNGETLDKRHYTYPNASPHRRWDHGDVDKDLLFAKFYDGYTINVVEYERHDPGMLRLRHDIERAFHSPVMSNIYLTPRNAQGLAPHWDTHDTFILQFTGVKDWMIYDSPILLPTPRQRIHKEDWTRVDPTLTATLEPGDLLYVPRGFVHEARSRDVVSGHVTIGLHTYTYADLLQMIANNADADPRLRKSLPVNFQSVASTDEFLGNVHRFFDNADLPAYIERMEEDFADDRLPDATDRLIDYVKLPSIGTGTRLCMRSVVCHHLKNGGEQVALTFHGKSLTFPAAAADSIRFMIGVREFEVGALPGAGEDNLALCSTLVREGFLSIV